MLSQRSGVVVLCVAFVWGLVIGYFRSDSRGRGNNVEIIRNVLERDAKNLSVTLASVVEYTALPSTAVIAEHVRKCQPFVVRGYFYDIARQVPLTEIIFSSGEDARHRVLQTRKGNLFAYMQKVSDAHFRDVRLTWPEDGAPVEKTNMSVSEILRRLHDQGSDLSEGSVVLTKKMPREFSDLFQEASKGIYDAQNVARVQVERLWIGRNTTTHTHYDESHNVYAQLGAEKIFVLFPPEVHASLKPYPESHPGYRQARISGLEEDVSALTTLLRKGDALYLPPMFYHRVSALDVQRSERFATGLEGVSVSASMWTESGIQHFKRRMTSLGLPTLLVGDSARNSIRLKRLSWFVGRLAREFLHSKNVSSFLRRVVLVRYTGYLFDEMRCSSDEQRDDVVLFPSSSANWFEDDDDEDIYILVNHAESHIRRLFVYFTTSFGNRDNSTRLWGIREIVLADMLELFVRTALPSGSGGVCDFFRTWVRQARHLHDVEGRSFY